MLYKIYDLTPFFFFLIVQYVRGRKGMWKSFIDGMYVLVLGYIDGMCNKI